MRALIMLGGHVPPRADLDAAWPGWSDGCALVIAADGGALRAASLGVEPDLVVGDADSLDASELARLRDRGVRVELAPVAKDATDGELAIGAALARDATDLVILGAFGGLRLDHALGNLGLLGLPALQDRTAALLDATSRVRLARGDPGLVAPGPAVTLQLPGRVGDLVTLLPLGGIAEGVTTDGLAYPLRDEPLTLGSTRGVSNVRSRSDSSVSLRRGHLYVIETSATALGAVGPVPTRGPDGPRPSEGAST